MSKEILFKAKRKNWRELPVEEWWVEGHYHHQTDYYGVKCDKHYIIDGTQTDMEGYGEHIEICPETICQYTGLQEYAEKDIVKRTDLHKVGEPSIGIIEYDEENTAFVIHWIDNPKYSPMYPWKDKIEIIGNIFDNPELLE